MQSNIACGGLCIAGVVGGGAAIMGAGVVAGYCADDDTDCI